MDAVEIDSLQTLLDYFDNDAAGKVRWFRGQRSSEWDLQPYLQRFDDAPSESNLLTRFKQNGSRLLESPAANDFDWLFLLQHYGVPTRLLDWTENPLIGLYFAVIKSSDEDASDGVLWELDPIALNAASGIDPATDPGFIPSFDDEELESYSVKSLSAMPRTQLKPIATIATRNSPRIQAQSGVFTVHHLIKDSLESILPEAIPRRFIIPSSRKPILRQQLDKMGITRFALFPELESIGASIRASMS